jgi:hypothetical protein
MKHLLYILVPLLLLAVGCAEDVNTVIPDEFEKADITGVTVYDSQLTVIGSSTSIAPSIREAVVTLNSKQDLAQLKVSLTVSSGATVISPLGTQVQDFSQPRTVRIVSPGSSVEREWILRVVNP